MNTILTPRPLSVRLVVGALLVSLIAVAVVVARALPSAASSTLDARNRAALPISAANARYLDVKERQAEQRYSMVVANAASTAASGPRERYEAMKEQQAARSDNSTGALVAAAPSAAQQRYLAMKERQAAQRDGTPNSTESAPISATR